MSYVAAPGHKRSRALGTTVSLLAVLVLLVAGIVGLGVQRGFQVYVVRTGSMSPALRPGDVVIDRRPTGSYHVGEVITFRSSAGSDAVVTHRIASIHGATIHTKGDANATLDPGSVTTSAVRGDVVRVVPAAGYVLVYLHEPSGVASLLCAIVAVALAWRMYFPSPGEPEPAVPAGTSFSYAAQMSR